MEQDISDLISDAQQDNSSSALIEWLSEEASFAFKGGSAAAFGELEPQLMPALLQVAEAQPNAEVCEKILTFVESEWQRIPDWVREEIRPKIIAVGGATYAPLVAFLTAEILGEYYADSSALIALNSFALSKNELVRTAAAVGITKLAKENKDSLLRRKCIVLLKQISSDAKPDVRREAVLGLQRLQATTRP